MQSRLKPVFLISTGEGVNKPLRSIGVLELIGGENRHVTRIDALTAASEALLTIA